MSRGHQNRWEIETAICMFFVHKWLRKFLLMFMDEKDRTTNSSNTLPILTLLVTNCYCFSCNTMFGISLKCIANHLYVEESNIQTPCWILGSTLYFIQTQFLKIENKMVDFVRGKCLRTCHKRLYYLNTKNQQKNVTLTENCYFSLIAWNVLSFVYVLLVHPSDPEADTSPR